MHVRSNEGGEGLEEHCPPAGNHTHSAKLATQNGINPAVNPNVVGFNPQDELLELLRVSGKSQGEEGGLREAGQQLGTVCITAAAYMYECGHAARCKAVGAGGGGGAGVGDGGGAGGRVGGYLEDDDGLGAGEQERGRGVGTAAGVVGGEDDWEDEDHIVDPDLDGADAPASLIPPRASGGSSVATFQSAALTGATGGGSSAVGGGGAGRGGGSKGLLARGHGTCVACLQLLRLLGREGFGVFELMRPLLDVEHDPEVRQTACAMSRQFRWILVTCKIRKQVP